jgi:predicted dehydrogenase
MKSTVRWGILGTGRIAKAYAEGLKNTRNGKLVAIASRNRESAELFAQEWEVENAFCSYEELAKSPLIDAVYVATPHTEHAKNAILCME